MLAMSLLSDYRVSIHRACRVVMFHRSGWYYKRKGGKRDLLLRARMRDIAQTRVRYGMWRIYTLLRREGCTNSHLACRCY
jgi:putative transposase